MTLVALTSTTAQAPPPLRGLLTLLIAAVINAVCSGAADLRPITAPGWLDAGAAGPPSPNAPVPGTPCGPANAAAFGLRCSWEAPGGVAGDNGTSTALGSGAGVPPQCCCVQARGKAGNKPLRRLWGVAGLPRCFPHAIIVGAQKGGTTALFAHFLMRPDFEAPASKEVRGEGAVVFSLVAGGVGGG
jgi:hypothetical protein